MELEVVPFKPCSTLTTLENTTAARHHYEPELFRLTAKRLCGTIKKELKNI